MGATPEPYQELTEVDKLQIKQVLDYWFDEKEWAMNVEIMSPVEPVCSD